RPGPREPPMEPTASRPAVPAPAPDATALAALLDCEADLDALERALLVAAVHPAWGGGRDAWLARWDERRGWLEGWRTLAASAEPGVLAHAIARARRAPPDGRPPRSACALGWRARK